MLSAANDILSSKNDTNSTGSTNTTNKYDCNDLSTGTILLADILPGLLIKLIAPLFAHKIKYKLRVLMIVLINICSFLLVALVPSDYQWLIFFGVACASISASFGEITFLSLSTFYDSNISLSGWSSGTGASGLIGSFAYAGLTSLGLLPRDTILSMLFIPFLMGFSYFILPSNNQKEDNDDDNVSNDQEETKSLIKNEPIFINTLVTDVKSDNNILKILKPLFKYMLPLFLVYISEYFINQGLFELLYFKDSFIKEHKLQYRWYNVVYQLAVFISRSSISLIKIKFLFIFPIFQLANVLILLSQIFFSWMPSVWILFVLIFWEGLLGGACYVNVFDMISIKIDKNVREISIGIASIAIEAGIAFAGFISIPTHNAICDFGRK
jgi:battenin